MMKGLKRRSNNLSAVVPRRGLGGVGITGTPAPHVSPVAAAAAAPSGSEDLTVVLCGAPHIDLRVASELPRRGVPVSQQDGSVAMLAWLGSHAQTVATIVYCVDALTTDAFTGFLLSARDRLALGTLPIIALCDTASIGAVADALPPSSELSQFSVDVMVYTESARCMDMLREKVVAHKAARFQQLRPAKAATLKPVGKTRGRRLTRAEDRQFAQGSSPAVAHVPTVKPLGVMASQQAPLPAVGAAMDQSPVVESPKLKVEASTPEETAPPTPPPDVSDLNAKMLTELAKGEKKLKDELRAKENRIAILHTQLTTLLAVSFNRDMEKMLESEPGGTFPDEAVAALVLEKEKELSSASKDSKLPKTLLDKETSIEMITSVMSTMLATFNKQKIPTEYVYACLESLLEQAPKKRRSSTILQDDTVDAQTKNWISANFAAQSEKTGLSANTRRRSSRSPSVGSQDQNAGSTQLLPTRRLSQVTSTGSGGHLPDVDGSNASIPAGSTSPGMTRQRSRQMQPHIEAIAEEMEVVTPGPELASAAASLPAEKAKLLRDWDFDPFEYSDDELIVLATNIYNQLDLLELFDLSDSMVIDFLQDVRATYKDNPYHNWRHAFDVMQSCFAVIVSSKLNDVLSPLEKFAVLTAALCHDMDHPGVNNAFQIHSKSPLAILYNDHSILENHHASQAFVTMRARGETSIVAPMTVPEFLDFRKIVIQTILNTDMAVHFELTDKFAAAVSHKSFSLDSAEHRRMVLNVLVHAADISNVGKPWKVSRKWSDLVLAEFLNQGDLEKDNGFAVSPNMDRDNTDQAKMSLGFIDFVVKPIFSALHDMFAKEDACPAISQAVENMAQNRQRWADIAAGASAPKPVPPKLPPTQASGAHLVDSPHSARRMSKSSLRIQPSSTSSPSVSPRPPDEVPRQDPIKEESDEDAAGADNDKGKGPKEAAPEEEPHDTAFELDGQAPAEAKPKGKKKGKGKKYEVDEG